MIRLYVPARVISIHTVLAVSAFAFSLGSLACSGATESSSAGGDVATQANELESAQCSLKAFDDAADTCRAAFEACLTAGGDKDSCRGTLEGCLPTAPPPVGPGGKGGGVGEGMPSHGPGGEPPKALGGEPPKGFGGEPPTNGEDGACDRPLPPPLPPPGASVDGGVGPKPPLPSGEKPEGPPGPHGPRGPRPEPAEVRACHDALKTCLDGAASDTDKKACLDVDHQCVRGAFEAAFAARCADDATKCSAGQIPSEVCAKITEHCAAGVAPPPEAKQPVCN